MSATARVMTVEQLYSGPEVAALLNVSREPRNAMISVAWLAPFLFFQLPRTRDSR